METTIKYFFSCQTQIGNCVLAANATNEETARDLILSLAKGVKTVGNLIKTKEVTVQITQ